jgi:hypothetical protein
MTDEKKSINDSLRDWGIDVDRFGERAKESLAGAKGDLSEVRGTLRQTLVEAKEIVLGLQSAGSPAATELKQGFERAWREIEQAFSAARQKARDAQPAEGETVEVAAADGEEKPPEQQP